jgi:hypothetical protein
MIRAVREISPYEGVTVDEILTGPFGQNIKDVILETRRQKQLGLRSRPSKKLVDKSQLFTAEFRAALLDEVASLVDENCVGRSEMCLQFASLLAQGLQFLGVDARPLTGKSFYFIDGKKCFDWVHGWVRAGDEIVDGNIDSTHENPLVPAALNLAPYWGPVQETPNDRKLVGGTATPIVADADVVNIWWPELKAWIERSPLTPEIPMRSTPSTSHPRP